MAVLVILDKILLIVFTFDFYSLYGPGSLKPSLSPFLSLSVRNGPSVSFGTDVP